MEAPRIRLPDSFDGIISALDAICDDKTKFTFQFVVSRCKQEEHRHNQRDLRSLAESEAAALLASRGKSKGDCVHCGKHNNSNKCWRKFPHVAPDGHPFKEKYKALISKNTERDCEEEDEEADIVCLLGKLGDRTEELKGISNNRSRTYTMNGWILDSGSSAHLTLDRGCFVSYASVPHKPVDLGAGSSAMIIGQGDVEISINVNGKLKQCIIKNINHAPALRLLKVGGWRGC